MTDPDRRPRAIMSYTRFDDEHNGGHLTRFCERLSNEVRLYSGDPFLIFQDVKDIQWGEPFEQRIETAITTVQFFIPILTPSFFKSAYCRAELQHFLRRAAELGQDDLILPVYYIRCPELEHPDRYTADELVQVLARHQYVDWRELRFKLFDSEEVRRMLARMAEQICDVLRAEQEQARQQREAQARRDAQYTVALQAYEQGDWVRASAALETLLHLFPDDAAAWRLQQQVTTEQARQAQQRWLAEQLQAARDAQARNDLRPAADRLQQVLVTFPNDATAQALLAQIQATIAQRDAAFERAETAFNGGDLGTARMLLDGLLAESPNEPRARALLHEVTARQQQEAQQRAEQARQQREAQERQQREAQARQQQEAQQRQQERDKLYRAAQTVLKRKQYGAAQESLDKLLAACPDDAEAQTLLAEVRKRREAPASPRPPGQKTRPWRLLVGGGVLAIVVLVLVGQFLGGVFAPDPKAPTRVARQMTGTPETTSWLTPTATIPTPTATAVPPTPTLTPVPPTATIPTPTATAVPPTTAPAWLPEMVDVPAGPFLMGSSDNDPAAASDEKPQHELTLPAYRIGKTEVTNAQFRPFVEGDGYTNRDYWTDAGWQWRETEHITSTSPAYWNDPQWNGDAQPVVGVSWYEAMAYARWLSVQTGQDYRLPTEAEWEKAARGTDGRIYPWGNAWQAGRANYGRVVSRTTPVGSYPDGASPYGALDMAGNAWEWTRSVYTPYPYTPDDGRESLEDPAKKSFVGRGGGWFYDSIYLRASDRYFNSPGYVDFVLGFRLAQHLPVDAES